jgi:ABC-type glycerol-3-phosphate transport system permease component
MVEAVKKPGRAARPAAQRAGVFFRYVALILWCVTTIFPLLWIINSSFKNNAQIFGQPLALPNPGIWGNFQKAWAAPPLR